MSERPVPIEEVQAGIPVAALERRTVSYVDLSDTERKWVEYVFNSGVKHLKIVAPSIASDIERQKDLAIRMAGVAKATFPVRKNYNFPSVPGSLGVAWLFPQAIKWTKTPDTSNPCYTSYKDNSWDIDVTAGTAAYLLGDGTNFYKANPTTEQHTFILIFENGVIEVGSTPTIEQFHLISEGKRDYGIYTVEPLVDIPIEKNVSIYQYPTPLGAVFVSHDRGIMWGFMPRTSGTKTIKLLGLVFYEHDFMSRLKWI
ncbi:MAG: hypothetical protein QW803_12180 [Candidatus Methanomethylicia archaeon]